MAVIGRGSDVTRMVDEGLRELALHEVGHTLGLSHNMRAINCDHLMRSIIQM